METSSLESKFIEVAQAMRGLVYEFGEASNTTASQLVGRAASFIRKMDAASSEAVDFVETYISISQVNLIAKMPFSGSRESLLQYTKCLARQKNLRDRLQLPANKKADEATCKDYWDAYNRKLMEEAFRTWP